MSFVREHIGCMNGSPWFTIVPLVFPMSLVKIHESSVPFLCSFLSVQPACPLPEVFLHVFVFLDAHFNFTCHEIHCKLSVTTLTPHLWWIWIGSHFVQRAGFAHSALQVPAASKIMGLAHYMGYVWTWNGKMFPGDVPTCLYSFLFC